MNLTNLLNFESMQYRGAQTQASAVNIFVANSLRTLIEDFYQRIAPAFIVIISCRRPSPMNFYRTIMQLLYENVDTMIIQLVHHNNEAPRRIEGPRLHNLLLVDSLDALLDIEIHTYTAQYDAHEYYYIFLQQRDARIPEDMQGVFEYCWRHQLIHCNVMTQSSGGEVIMHTYFPYTPTHCGHIVAVKINQFMGDAWQHRDYFPSKLKNFYQCPLPVVVRKMPPFFNVIGLEALGLHGLEGQLLQELANRLNFTIRLIALDKQDDDVWTEHQMLQLLQERKAQVAVGYIRKRLVYDANLTAVFPHYSNMLVSCLLKNAYNLTSIEMLRFPFQTITWLMLLLILSWLCFTLIVRAMYSALLYHVLRHHVHRRLPKTLLELMQGGYTAVLNRITLQDLSEVVSFEDFFSKRHVIIHSELEVEVLQNVEMRVQSPEAGAHPKIFGVLSRDTLMYLASKTQKPGAYHIVDESVIEQQLAMYLQKHSYLVQQFDQLIMSIQAVGLMNYWSSQLANEQYFRNMFLYREKRLRQPDLWGIYIIAATLYSFALLIFIGELLAELCSRLWTRWRIKTQHVFIH
ncbi:uncharacterized protein LOC115627662 [Scaptodrosophila lebanonensis]|uniref:Uncharacterized protein LOC115627662 n=1 Tax=Drosophila lebanonensis TaxID=7225 RepID=A0A6J2TT69_DROLE|nr:uncharacterized protein LOC115627662 [Scaptodrosophila lebanonensis]